MKWLLIVLFCCNFVQAEVIDMGDGTHIDSNDFMAKDDSESLQKRQRWMEKANQEQKDRFHKDENEKLHTQMNKEKQLAQGNEHSLQLLSSQHGTLESRFDTFHKIDNGKAYMDYNTARLIHSNVPTSSKVATLKSASKPKIGDGSSLQDMSEKFESSRGVQKKSMLRNFFEAMRKLPGKIKEAWRQTKKVGEAVGSRATSIEDVQKKEQAAQQKAHAEAWDQYGKKGGAMPGTVITSATEG